MHLALAVKIGSDLEEDGNSTLEIVEEISFEDEQLSEDEMFAEEMLLAELEEPSNEITGNAVRGKPGKGNKITYLSCNDTDEGKDYYEYGIVTIRYLYHDREYVKEFYDSCNKRKVSENYCNGNRPATSRYNCPDGCDGGKCIAPTVCGNGIVEEGEECDSGVDIFCIDLAYEAGYLGCGSDCRYDESACVETLVRSYSFALDEEDPPFTENISVLSGWNEFQFTILPTDNSRENVLASIDGDYSHIKTFENGELLYWDETFPDFVNTLHYINFGQNYRINMKVNTTIIIDGYPDPSKPYWVNTSWTEWLNISCLPTDLMNQSRSKTQYDWNGIDLTNITFFEYRDIEYCEYNPSSAPVIDFVLVENANPTMGGTTLISITSQITDIDGVDDIGIVNAEFIVGSPANGNAITSITRGNCNDIDDDTIECNATYNMQFYDEAMAYTIQVYAEDNSGKNATDTDSFDYSELIALEIDDDNIGFGEMFIEQEKEVLGDEDWSSGTTTIKNQGNAVIDAMINATDLSGTEGSFLCENVQIRIGALSYYNLTNENRIEAGLSLDYGQSKLENVDFKIKIPQGVSPGAYTGNIMINAVGDS